MTSSDIWEVAGAILASLGGAVVILGALVWWLGDLWAKRMLEREAHKRTRELEELKAQLSEANERSKAALAAAQAQQSAKLSHAIYVSKTQYDLEFDIYQTIWNKLEFLRALSINSWTPLYDSLKSGAVREEELSKAQQTQQVITQSCKEFVEYYMSKSPFIAESVLNWIDKNNEKHLADFLDIYVQAVNASRNCDLDAFSKIMGGSTTY